MYALKLKEFRRRAGFKRQKDIAEALGIKERKYASWEREEVALTLEDAYRLALLLDCTPNDLCGLPKGKNEGHAFEDKFEQELLDCYRTSTVDRKGRILDTARDNAAMSKEAAKRAAHQPEERRAG